MELPDVIPQNITREVTTWGVNWKNSLNLQFSPGETLRQLQHDQFHSLAKSRLFSHAQRAYRATSRPQSLKISASLKQPQPQVTQYTLVDIQPYKTELASIADIEFHGDTRLAINFSVPANLEIIELSTIDLEDWFVTPAENPNQALLTVQFNKPQQKPVRIILRGHALQQASTGESFELAIPEFLEPGKVPHTWQSGPRTFSACL